MPVVPVGVSLLVVLAPDGCVELCGRGGFWIVFITVWLKVEELIAGVEEVRKIITAQIKGPVSIIVSAGAAVGLLFTSC